MNIIVRVDEHKDDQFYYKFRNKNKLYEIFKFVKLYGHKSNYDYSSGRGR